MARVTKQTARKDYPESGIKAGQEYYKAQIKLQRGGITKRKLTPFKPSELTTSEYKIALYGLMEEVEACPAKDLDRDDIVSQLEEIGQEEQNKFDNMPEGLQQGDTGQLLEERANACYAAGTDIERIDWPDPDDFDGDAIDDAFEDAKLEIADALQMADV